MSQSFITIAFKPRKLWRKVWHRRVRPEYLRSHLKRRIKNFIHHWCIPKTHHKQALSKNKDQPCDSWDVPRPPIWENISLRLFYIDTGHTIMLWGWNRFTLQRLNLTPDLKVIQVWQSKCTIWSIWIKRHHVNSTLITGLRTQVISISVCLVICCRKTHF